MSPTILYLDTIPGDPIQALTLAGIRRYAAAWAPGADQYLRDCIALFNEYGWDWTYHAFRESPVWDVEKERGADGKYVPSPDNPRKRTLLDGFGEKSIRSRAQSAVLRCGPYRSAPNQMRKKASGSTVRARRWGGSPGGGQARTVQPAVGPSSGTRTKSSS